MTLNLSDQQVLDLFGPTPTELTGSDGHAFVDGDTLRNTEGKLLRIEGLTAAEIMRLDPEGKFTAGDPGGTASWVQLRNLAENFGFNNVVYLTNPDGSPKMDATGNRQLVRLRNNKGEDFTQTVLRKGITKLGAFSTAEDIEAWQWGDAQVSEATNQVLENKELDDWEKAQVAINDATNAETWKEKEFQKVALNEKELYNLTKPRQPGESIEAFALRQREAQKYNKSMVYNDWLDRDITNHSLHPGWDGFGVGWDGAAESIYGAIQMIGEKTDIPGFSEWLKGKGEQGVARNRELLMDVPNLKLNALKPVLDDDGNIVGNEWDINGIGEFFEYIKTNAAISLPYMGASILGTVLAPATKGVSLALPVSIFTGQTYNEMEGTPEEKRATLAVAAGVTMTVLDRLGIKFLMGNFKGTLLNEAVRNKMVKAYVQKQAANGNIITEDAARLAINKMTRVESAKLLGNAAEIAKQQLTAVNFLKSFSSKSVLGFSSEALTEAGQELTGYMAAVAGSNKKFNPMELQNRMLNALIAGGTIGSAFSVPGTLYDAGKWADVAVRGDKAEQKRLSFAGEQAQEEKRKTGKIQTIKEINTVVPTPSQSGASDFNSLSNEGKKQQKSKDAFEKVKDMWSAIPVLWRGSTRFIFTEAIQKTSQAMRELASMFGGNLQRIHSGENFEERKRNLLTKYRNLVKTPAEYAKMAGFGTINQAKLSQIINEFHNWINNKTKQRSEKNKKLTQQDWNSLDQEANLKDHKFWLNQWYSDTTMLADKLYEAQKYAWEQNNPGKSFEKQVGRRGNYLQRYKSFDKGIIEKNQNEFAEALVKEFGMDLNTAKDITRDIVEDNNITGFDNVFDVGKGKHIPSQHKKNRLGLAERDSFKKFMENDSFVNISNSAKAAARFQTYQEFLGDNNQKIYQKLMQAEQEGVDRETIAKVAAQLQDYLNAESGNYKRLESKTLARVQKNLLFFTTLAGLPLAVVSSFVEIAMTVRALTPTQISKTIMSASKEFAQAAWSTIKDPRYSSTQRQLEKEERQANIKRLGYFDWDVGAAQTTGATENTHASRKLLDRFFRIILLQQWTDYTRNIRASIASDFIMNHVNLIARHRQAANFVGPQQQWDQADAIYTNEVQEAEEQLRNLGIDVDWLVDYVSRTDHHGQQTINADGQVELRLSDAQKYADSKFDNMMVNAESNFVNEAIALPMTYNRPLFYQNQHLALFTQFQGFIATFTANHIPRMWGDYVKRGTPAMKYNMFAIMTTMIALGFAAQYLKDLIKYGKPSPYLDDMEKLQRGFGASGLIGVAERPLNFVFPIYETSSKNPVEWIFNNISGEAAALSNVARAGEGAVNIIQGKTEQGAYKLFKITPGIGPFNQGNKWLARNLFGE
jgi:hypothetical protein